MTDTTDPIVAPTDPAAGASAGPDVSAADTPTDYTTHPVWGRAIEAIPEVLRGPLLETIKTSEAESQKAIEKARGEGGTISAEWRELIAEADELGLTVEQLAGAYVGQQQLQEMLVSDPDAFVATLQTQVDQLVAAGTITRKEGAAAMREGRAAASEVADDLLTDEQKQIRDLQAWKDQQEQREQQARAAQQQREQQTQLDAQLEAQAEAYFDVFDDQMIAVGLMTRDASGTKQATIPLETLTLIAKTGGELIDANPRLKPEQAVKQAYEQIKRTIEAVGGKLGPQAAAQVPVIGGGSARPSGVPAPTGQPRTMEDRESAALAELMRMRGES